MKMSFVKSLICSFVLSVFAMQNQAVAQIKRYYSERDKSDTETVTTITSDPDPASMVTVVLLVLTLYWSVRGFFQLFQRHDGILVIFYLIFLFPIAYCHMLLLGIFGRSKAKREQSEEK